MVEGGCAISDGENAVHARTEKTTRDAERNELNSICTTSPETSAFPGTRTYMRDATPSNANGKRVRRLFSYVQGRQKKGRQSPLFRLSAKPHRPSKPSEKITSFTVI